MCISRRSYSQGPQLGHVVEAGQWNEGDVVVVEGAVQDQHMQDKQGEKRKQKEW